ncbi:hypothetical protein FKV42_01865 [Methanolobus vulcani]|uniref:Uncharacterized protein n=1 Tax=Methanolobus vulcani TaxID=38026 RepID=A0A7Z8KQV8_9EURY|nr:hypothetical protein FKV42_01865 [Methanolobus vulcani]
MTFKSIVNRTNIPLLLISFSYLSMWVLGIIAHVLIPFTLKINIPIDITNHVALVLFYILSLILPVIGTLLFMNDVKRNSNRWFLAIPFLLSIFLLTYLRDYLYMGLFYEISFISDTISLPFFDSKIGLAFISIFYSISSILLVLSMSDIRRKVMRIPIALSIVMTASITINFLVNHFSKTYIPENQIFGILHIICILLFGLFLSWFAVFEKKANMTKIQKI